MNQIQTNPDPKTTHTSFNHARGPESARSDILRRRWWLVLIIAAVSGGATYGISKKAVPAQYSSTATVSVQVTGAFDPSQSATGANSIAAQYAQIVSSGIVLQAATKTLAPQDANGLTTSVSGGTVADQNLVQIRATGSSAGQAQRRAAAVVTALTGYVAQTVSRETNAYSAAARQQLRPISDQIQKISRQISRAPLAVLTTARYVALQQTLSTLIAQRSAAEASIAQSSTGGHPSLNLLSSAGPGSIVAPKPALYAGVAFVLALILVSQAVVYFTPRRA
jgi:capsular polysaccharide biosynthesis protein